MTGSLLEYKNEPLELKILIENVYKNPFFLSLTGEVHEVDIAYE